LKINHFIKKYTVDVFKRILSLLLICCITTSFTPKCALSFGIKTIVIDAGHGGKDPGCHGKNNNEKDIALSVALKLGKFINEKLPDVKVVYTRQTDVFIELQERANIANKAEADLFISIHCNAACFRDKQTKKDICKEQTNGTETYVMDIKNESGNLNVSQRENSSLLFEDDYVEKVKGFDPNSDEAFIIMSMFNDRYLTHSLNFASKLQYQYRERVGRTDRGVKRASLWVLWRTSMPSVLTEIGYLTNPDEEIFLGSDAGQDQIASSLFRAFKEYKQELEGGTSTVKESAPISTIADTIKPKTTTSPKVIPLETPISVTTPKPTPTPPAQPKITTELKIPAIKDSLAAVKPQPKAPSLEVVYKVQFLSSASALPLNAKQFSGIANIGEYVDKGTYKYTSGEFADRATAAKACTEIRNKGFKDAFVIAMQNGKRITGQ
jgi:N-acetylmuramoyl-L-alanine amidase